MNRDELPDDLRPIADQLASIKDDFDADGATWKRIDGGWELQLRFMDDE